MIRIENLSVYGWEAAIRGMRNPMNSWDKSDSEFNSNGYPMFLGDNDLDLMRKLIKGGPEHRKFLRMIVVTVDITAPLYWWKEFDTYKVGTVANSCSTMHKIAAKPFDLADFSHEHMDTNSIKTIGLVIDRLNQARYEYVVDKDKEDWWQMIQLLPSSYNQKRTVQLNYETLITIIKQREGHKLDEWNDFVEWTSDLPYMYELLHGLEY